jgi:hypothetical protein
MDTEVVGPRGMVMYEFDRGGKVASIEYYFDRDRGLRAAGLET